ncbi:MAG: lysozyme [Methylocella sp.]
MDISEKGLLALIGREGSRLKAYRDSRGIWTIGVGHTGRASPPSVHAGMTITPDEEMRILHTDLAPEIAAVNRAIRVSISQDQFDACVSLAFNIGAHGFVGSTVVHMINAGNLEAAANAFLMWDHPSELKGRREAEREQFLGVAA